MSVSRFVIEEYLAELRCKEKLSTATIRNRDATIQTFIHKFLYQNQELREAYIKVSPYNNGLISGPIKQKIIVSCTVNELLILMEQTKFERERLILQFIFDSGIRSSELKNITRQHIIDAQNYNIHSLSSINKQTADLSPYAPLLIEGSKGRHNSRKQRVTLISRAVLMRIERYHSSPLYRKFARNYESPSNTPAFFNTDGKQVTAKCLSKLLYRLSSRAIKAGAINKLISPHKLRHGFAYDLLQSPDIGETYVDRLAVVQKSLGHSFLSSTEVYTKIPIELYKTFDDEKENLITKANRMESIVQRTQLKISIKDKR